MSKIRIVLAEDHQVVRQGMKALLNAQPDLEVVGEAADGQELIQLVWKLNPDVVISDIAMPTLNGIESTTQIHKHFPQVKVIILSMHSASPYVIRALRSGALGYLLKDDDIENVIKAIHTVMKGSHFVSSQVSETVMTMLLSGQDPTISLENRVTGRERQILQLVAEGSTSAQIAEKLCISPRTVEKHRANLMSKLNLTSQVDIVRFAIKNGLVNLQE